MLKAGKDKKSFIFIYFQSILEIIEDKPSFVFPFYMNQILVFFFLIQILGYVYSHSEIKPITEAKFSFIAYLNELSTGTFLLSIKGNHSALF